MGLSNFQSESILARYIKDNDYRSLAPHSCSVVKLTLEKSPNSIH